MPQRLRFTLRGERPPHPFQHATHLRALVLAWLAGADPTLATEIHDANQPKPFTISPLYETNGMSGYHWFEVSLLADDLLDPLILGMSRAKEEVRLGTQWFRLEKPSAVASARWDELWTPGAGMDDFSIRVLSPTAHHLAGPYRKSAVLPSPELYFGSWLNRWNLFAPQPFEQELMRIVEEQVAVTECTGGTLCVHLDGSRVFVGFEGNVRFGVLKRATLSLEDKAALTALARFSTFCGTGVETMRGMGQTLLVQ